MHEVGVLHNAQDRGIVLYTTKPHEQRTYAQRSCDHDSTTEQKKYLLNHYGVSGSYG